MKIRFYSELIKLKTFEERYQYLRLSGKVGEETFGSERYLNQYFYMRDPRWKKARRQVIIRDNGCDLGVDGYEIRYRVIVHHMNPVSSQDIIDNKSCIYDPEFLICVSHNTHEAIHFGDEDLLIKMPVERRPGDTCPWKHF